MPEAYYKNEILMEMEVAECKFNYAKTIDEIDSAIFSLNAARMKLRAFLILNKGSVENQHALVW